MQHQIINVPAVKTQIERIVVEEVVVQPPRNQISIALEVEEARFLRDVLGARNARMNGEHDDLNYFLYEALDGFLMNSPDRSSIHADECRRFDALFEHCRALVTS